jgi:hypothetical protein
VGETINDKKSEFSIDFKKDSNKQTNEEGCEGGSWEILETFLLFDC